MKISNSTQNYINQPYANQTNSVSTIASKMEKPVDVEGDSLNISPTTRDLLKISAAIDNEPVDRTKLVADLKQQVQAGQYTVNAEQVAEKMVGSFMNRLG